MSETHELLAVTPIDGRYGSKTEELREVTSEFALIRNRFYVETEWLSTLGSGILPDKEPLSGEAVGKLQKMSENFSMEDALAVKAVEARTNHDVKAVEVVLKDKLKGDKELESYSEMVHFGRTSEDINNLAYAMMLSQLREEVLIPKISEIGDTFAGYADEWADIPMLARTHGQDATPTTLGREFNVFAHRIGRSVQELGAISICGKLNGATGSYNAEMVAYPEVNWEATNTDFVERMGFEPTELTTQIEPHDYIARYLYEWTLANTILLDAAKDTWQYISLGYLKQKVKEGETGSSTMPHKVNPIDFENYEGNSNPAISLALGLAVKLPVSRLQRDLSDSSALRSIGDIAGHSLVGYKSLLRGLGKIEANPDVIAKDLESNDSILTEALQSVMRRYEVAGAYDIVKDASRGKDFDKDAYLSIVDNLAIPEDAKERLRQLTPETYIGKAAELARRSVPPTSF